MLSFSSQSKSATQLRLNAMVVWVFVGGAAPW